MLPSPPFTTVASAAIVLGLAAATATLLVLVPDALTTLEDLPWISIGPEQLLAFLALAFNVGAIGTVLAGPGTVLHRLVWAVLILLPLGMLAYAVFGRAAPLGSAPSRSN